MVNSRIRSCFITAPAGTNLDVLTDALRRRDIRVVGPEAIRLARHGRRKSPISLPAPILPSAY